MNTRSLLQIESKISQTIKIARSVLGISRKYIQKEFPQCTITHVGEKDLKEMMEIVLEYGTLTCPIDWNGRCNESYFFFDSLEIMPHFVNYFESHFLSPASSNSRFDWIDSEKNYGVTLNGDSLTFSFYENHLTN